MRQICPYCNANLALQRLRRIPLKGESRVVTLRWFLECPQCHGALQANPPPIDKKLIVGIGAAVALCNLIGILTPFKASGVVWAVMLAAVIVVPAVLRLCFVPKDWPKYVPYAGGREPARQR